MKKSIVVCVLVLAACLCLQVNGAEYRGKTDDCKKESEESKNTCHRFLCDDKTGEFEVQTCGPAAIYCPEGQVADAGLVDLAKPYPDCCPTPSCRDA